VAIGQRGYNTRIKWHVDYYLTGEYWRFEALRQQEPSRLLYSLGPGRFKRGPESLKRPDSTQPRKWVASSETEIREDSIGTQQWIILSYQKTENSKTTIEWLFWREGETLTIAGDGTYETCNYNVVYTGQLEEFLGLDPDTIIGAWISPISPGSTADVYKYTADGHTRVARIGQAGNIGNAKTFTISGETDDEEKYVIVDPFGAVQATTPWGVAFDKILCSVVASPEDCYLAIYLQDSASTLHAGEGRVFTLPLLRIPITSNAWSSYVYSGQREYDIEQKRIQQKQALASGIANAGQGAISGGIAGGLTKAGGTVGAIAGLGVAIGGSIANYAITGYFDEKAQASTDRFVSNQTGSIIAGNGSPAWKNASFMEKAWKIVKLVRDSQSAAELTAEQSELGYITDTYAADCSTIVATGGGLRIEGLEVKGGISREGREYIAALFARGVHIDILT